MSILLGQPSGFIIKIFSCAHCGNKDDRLDLDTCEIWQIRRWEERHKDCEKKAEKDRTHIGWKE